MLSTTSFLSSRSLAKTLSLVKGGRGPSGHLAGHSKEVAPTPPRCGGSGGISASLTQRRPGSDGSYAGKGAALVHAHSDAISDGVTGLSVALPLPPVAEGATSADGESESGVLGGSGAAPHASGVVASSGAVTARSAHCGLPSARDCRPDSGNVTVHGNGGGGGADSGAMTARSTHVGIESARGAGRGKSTHWAQNHSARCTDSTRLSKGAHGAPVADLHATRRSCDATCSQTCGNSITVDLAHSTALNAARCDTRTLRRRRTHRADCRAAELERCAR